MDQTQQGRIVHWSPGGARAIIRNQHGEVLLAACSPIPHCDDTKEVDAIAALRGVSLLDDLGLSKVIVSWTALV